jgi:hypothetical protein
MASIVYLDVDDEITSAAARIRQSPEARLAIVLPAGSRVSTSRINFRLLAREAQRYGRDLAIVALDAGTRALAASAGIAAFATVPDYELAVTEADAAAVAEPVGPPEEPEQSGDSGGSGGGSSSGGGGGSGGPGGGSGAGTPGGAPAGRGRGAAGSRQSKAGAAAPPPAMKTARGTASPPPGPPMTGVRARTGLSDTATVLTPEVPPDQPRHRGPSALIVAALGVLIVVLLVAGTATWLVLPTATVVVRSRAEPVGPLQITVRADPLALSVNEDAGIVPAQIVPFDLSVTDEFPTTGTKVTETPASGSVRWSNCDQVRSYTIKAGSIVRTRGGLGFATADEVFLPRATSSGQPPRIEVRCQTRDVDVKAVEAGIDGNVPAEAINQVPTAIDPNVISVINPAATAGGTHVEKQIVAQKDVDSAITALAKALRDQFTVQVDDPSRAPAGTTIYAGTKSMSAPLPTVDPDSLVGQAGATFELGMTGTGTATAVDPNPVEQLGETRVRAAVPKDRSLVAGSVSVTVGAGRVDGSAVVFPVTARAGQVAALDAAAIRAAVKGMSVDEARVRLRDYGDATVDTWPGWVTSITTFDFRLAVTVVSDVPTEPVIGPSASPRPSPSPTPRPTLPPIVPGGSAAPSGSAGAGPSAPGSVAPAGSSSTSSPAPSAT